MKKEIEELLEKVHKDVKALYPKDKAESVIIVADEENRKGKVVGNVEGDTLAYAVQELLDDNEDLRKVIVDVLISEQK